MLFSLLCFCQKLSSVQSGFFPHLQDPHPRPLKCGKFLVILWQERAKMSKKAQKAPLKKVWIWPRQPPSVEKIHTFYFFEGFPNITFCDTFVSNSIM